MKALVIYDSQFGNTEAIARAIAEGIGGYSRTALVREVQPSQLDGTELLVVGSPTQGGKPTRAVVDWLSNLSKDSLKGKSVAAFDTRIDASTSAVPLRLLMKLIGYATPRIASSLQHDGGRLLAPVEGFIVDAKEGPLRDGEAARARNWAQRLAVGVGR